MPRPPRGLRFKDNPDAWAAAYEDFAAATVFELERYGREAAQSEESLRTFIGDFIGDSGSGGAHGLVLAPAAGDANKVLRGNKSWADLVALLLSLSFGAGNLADTTAPTSWTPTDQSGFGPAFSAVSCRYAKLFNFILGYGTLTYGASVDNHNAAISLPVAVPNQSYAFGVGAVRSTVGPAGMILEAESNTSVANFIVSGSGSVLNSQMSGSIVRLMLIYPAT